MSETPKYRRGIDPMPAGTYQENDDGTYSPAVPYEPPPIRFYLAATFPAGGEAMSTADDAPTTECAVLHRHYGVRSWITFNPPVGTKDGADDA